MRPDRAADVRAQQASRCWLGLAAGSGTAQRRRPRLAPLALAFALPVGLLGCQPPAAEPTSFQLQGQALGTSWSCVLSRLPSSSAWAQAQGSLRVVAGARTAIESALAEVDLLASTWREDSELSALNQSLLAGTGAEFKPSAELGALFTVCQQAWTITRGRFDPSVAELVGALGFGAQARPVPVTSEPELDRLKSRLGWQKLHWNGVECALLPDSDGPRELDLSGVAKGFAVDRAAQALRELGLVDFLLEVGGELVLAGSSPRGDAWRQGVDRPVASPDEARSAALRFELEDRAVATSGDYRQWRESNGKRFSHVIDPTLGRSTTSEVASVTVLADTCALADALATGLMVLGAEPGLAAIEATPGVEALFLLHAPGGLRLLASQGFPVFELAPDFEAQLVGELPAQARHAQPGP